MVGYCLLRHAQSLCDPLLWDTETVHAKYLYVHAHLGCGPKIGYVRVHCSSRAANSLSYICGCQGWGLTVGASCSFSCLVFCQLSRAYGLFGRMVRQGSAIQVYCWPLLLLHRQLYGHTFHHVLSFPRRESSIFKNFSGFRLSATLRPEWHI